MSLDEVKEHAVVRNLILSKSLGFKSRVLHPWDWMCDLGKSSSHSISLNLIFFHYKTEIKNISYLIGQLGR